MERLIDLKLELPAALAARLDALIGGALRAAWLDGLKTGLTWAVLGCVAVAVVVMVLRGKR